MTATKISVKKIETQVAEGRLAQGTHGFQIGVLKRTIDKFTDALVVPVGDRLRPMMRGIHPGLQLVEPVVDPVIKYGLLIAIAEMIAASSSVVAKIPGLGLDEAEADEKMKEYAKFLRMYAAEILGGQAVDGMMWALPKIAEMVKGMDLSAITGTLVGQNAEVAAELPQEQSA